MIRKLTIASLGLLSLLSFSSGAATPARADVDVDIRLNLGYGGWGVIGVPRGSCRHGLRVLERRFNHVRPIECAGRYYTYYGRRNGRLFVIALDSLSGRIVDIHRARRR